MDFVKMPANEILAFSDLADKAKYAEKAAKIIEEYSKRIDWNGQKMIKVYHTQNGKYAGDGYLTSDGAYWYYDNWYGLRSYGILCTKDGIYNMLRSCYLREKNLQHLDVEKFDCQIEFFDKYFEEFISQIESK